MEKHLNGSDESPSGPAGLRARLECQNEALAAHPVLGKIELAGAELTIGRGEANNIALKADGVSRIHARLYAGDGGWGVEDLGSTNGVLVNGNRVDKALLKPGDTLLIGTVTYKYLTLEQQAPASADLDEDDEEDAFEKTVIMRPTVKQQITAQAGQQKPAPQPAKAAPPPPPPPAPKAATPPRAKTTSTAKRPAPKSATSNSHWWIMILGVALVIAFLFLL